MPFPAVRRLIHYVSLSLDLAERVAAAQALVVRHRFPDDAAAEDDFSAFGHLEAFFAWLSVEDGDHFAAAVGALRGFRVTAVTVLFSWFIALGFTLLSIKKECRVVILGPISRIPPLFRHSWWQ